MLAALRKQNLNEYGKSWTREELSKYMHISPHQLGRLERGNRKYLDTETLQLLADAFNLTALERKELFFAAVGVSEDAIVGLENTQAKAEFENLISTLEKIRAPAFIVDDYADLVAVNMSIMKLYQVNPDYVARGGESYSAFNLLKFIYDETSGYKSAVGAAWENMARRNMNFFRRISLRQRHKPYFNQILSELCRIKKFDLHWHEISRSPSDVDSVYDIFKWHHPAYGPVHLVFTEASLPTRYGNLYLFTYSPMDIETAAVFLEISSEMGGTAFRFAPWPFKPLNEKEDQEDLEEQSN